jgi:drug/metabolite transporter (DMT)-like permease
MLVASAFAGIALSHVMYYAAIVRIGLALCAGVILVQPVITSTASYFLFQERLTLAQWLSGVTAMGGAVILLYTQRRLAQPPTSPPPPD